MPGESTEIAVAFKKTCLGLLSLDRKVRKRTYADLEKFLVENFEGLSGDDLRDMFDETFVYTMNGLRDKAETVREQAIEFLRTLYVDLLPINDYYITYLLPVLVERIGTVELVEESEEIRLQLVKLLREVVVKYSKTKQLRPFLNDCVCILVEMVKDKFPDVKELSCRLIVELSTALPNDFHMQAETLIGPVLSCFGHQRYKVRVSAVDAIGEIVLRSSHKGLDESVGPMAERLFDQVPAVRVAVARNAARWLMKYRDRYSFFYKILPLLLTGLNDEIEETRRESAALWEKVGLQYQEENFEELKEELDYLYKTPRFYPEGLTRPNLGCRTLVKRNLGRLTQPLSRELLSWQPDVRVRCSQLLCSLALHAEEGIIQNLQDLLVAMYSAARDDDARVRENVGRASEIIGCFVKFDVWWDLIEPLVEESHHGHLFVLGGIVKGSPDELIAEHLEAISTVLADDMVCATRRDKYQLQLLRCVKALLSKHHRGSEGATGYNLFKITVTLLSLRHPDNETAITGDFLATLATSLGLTDVSGLWLAYAKDLLKHVSDDPGMWTVINDHAAVFMRVLSDAGEALGENLDVTLRILEVVLVEGIDAELKLKIFYLLANVFERKDVSFRQAGKEDLIAFLEQLIRGVFVPALIWHPGATAEAIRTMSSCCLRHALTPTENVDLFTPENLKVLSKELNPLLLSLTNDAVYKSRRYGIECLALLKENCCGKGVWTTEDLIYVYPALLKRLDDPTDLVRASALDKLPVLFRDAPDDFRSVNYRAHHELIIDTVLTHFDDEEAEVRKKIYETLEVMAEINLDELLNKIKRHKPLLGNQEGCDMILTKFERPV